MSKVRFSDDFPRVSTEEWEAQIQRDLKAAGVEKSLLWHMPDGLTVRPYYRKEDVERLDAVRKNEPSPVYFPTSFRLRQDIATTDIEKARRHARAAIEGGVDILGLALRMRENTFSGIPLTTREAFATFAEGLPLHRVEMHVEGGPYSPALAAFLFDLVADRGSSREASFTVAFDPINEMVRTGQRPSSELDLAADMMGFITKRFPRGRIIRIGVEAFHAAGSTPVQETALLLASASELIVQMIERGVHARDLAGHVYLSIPVGTSYFVEIARMRALRMTFAQLLSAFLPEEDVRIPPLHGETSTRVFTLYDPHVNMLRATTAAASAIIGGCDVVGVRSFDEPAGRLDEFSYRMARNIGHLLRDEAGAARVVDAAAGSYYVEVLTDAVARRAWQFFQDIEARGGLIASLESGYVHERLDAVRTRQADDLAKRRRVLIGSNMYPDPAEKRSDDLNRAARPATLPLPEGTTYSGGFEPLREQLAAGEAITVLDSIRRGPRLCAPLQPRRDAEVLEQLRLRTERSGRASRILVATVGTSAEGRKRARFAVHFLGCGGFQAQVYAGPGSVDEIAAAIGEADPDAVVLCTSDAELPELLDHVKREHGRSTTRAIVIIVAPIHLLPELNEEAYDLAVDDETHLIEALSRLQELLGIRERVVEVEW